MLKQVAKHHYQKNNGSSDLGPVLWREGLCPDWIDITNTKKTGMVGLIEKISSQQVSAQVKIEIMQRAMAACPKINMGCGRKVIPSLLDSGSQVTLICQSFFEQEILPHIKPADGEKAKAQ